jgi:hypothetical protein
MGMTGPLLSPLESDLTLGRFFWGFKKVLELITHIG